MTDVKYIMRRGERIDAPVIKHQYKVVIKHMHGDADAHTETTHWFKVNDAEWGKLQNLMVMLHALSDFRDTDWNGMCDFCSSGYIREDFFKNIDLDYGPMREYFESDVVYERNLAMIESFKVTYFDCDGIEYAVEPIRNTN